MHKAPNGLHKTLSPLGFQPQLLSAGSYRAAKGQHYPPHYHPALELIVYEEGFIDCLLGEAEPSVIKTRPGMALLIPAGQVHADRAITPYAQTYLQLKQAAPEPPCRSPRVFDDADRSLGSVATAVANEWNSQEGERERMLELLLEQLGIVLRRLDTEQQPSRAERLVRRAESTLRAKLALSFSIRELASELDVAPSTLREYFIRQRGQSPKAFLLDLRLRRAVELIQTASLSLEEIASLTGYYSASHLSRHVKQVTGKPPGAYRRLNSE